MVAKMRKSLQKTDMQQAEYWLRLFKSNVLILA